MLIDTHAHINHELLKDKPNVLENVGVVICPSYNVETCHSSFEMSQNFDNVFSALAIHPSDEKTWNDDIKNFIKEKSQNKRVVALGEYGLDYHYLPFDRISQQNVMLNQLELAKQVGLPSIFHIRDAFSDFIPMLKENLSGFCGGVVHCFDEGKQVAKQVLDLGLMISFTGLITHKKKDELREALSYVPIDRIMLETDSPYLAPEPFRGQVCVPSYVQKVYEKVAEIKGIKQENLEEIIQENVKKFFKKLVF